MIDYGTGSTGLVAALLPGTRPARTARGRYRQLADGLTEISRPTAWLLHTVITRVMPNDDDVTEAVRYHKLHGSSALLRKLLSHRNHPGAWLRRPVRVIKPTLLLDIHETGTAKVQTGVQRVANAIAVRWAERPDVTVVGWSPDRRQLRPMRLTSEHGGRITAKLSRHGIAPLGGTYFVPEVFTNPVRTSLTESLVKNSGTRGVLYGHDCIPLTLPETTGPGMPGAFSKYLAAAAHMELVVCNSHASASEYQGWRDMLASIALDGPRITAMPLAVEIGQPDPTLETEARRQLLVGDPETGETLPMILCVGSHEPRKNHAAVLHAAETLWRHGHRFSLTFIGGASWSRDEFDTQLTRLTRIHRPITLLDKAPDELLWWAYRLARFTVFPSFGEGFGLPVAEALLSGTPVITSGFGSMAEIAEGGGCLLIDPHSHTELASAMRRLLTDDAELDELRRQAEARDFPRWDDYAEQLWHQAMA